MSLSTPRTDAYEYDAGWAAARYGERWKPMDFARALERELVAERDKVRVLREALNDAQSAALPRREWPWTEGAQ